MGALLGIDYNASRGHDAAMRRDQVPVLQRSGYWLLDDACQMPLTGCVEKTLLLLLFYI